MDILRFITITITIIALYYVRLGSSIRSTELQEIDKVGDATNLMFINWAVRNLIVNSVKAFTRPPMMEWTMMGLAVVLLDLTPGLDLLTPRLLCRLMNYGNS